MSDDLSPILALPLLQPSQAQKHVTHNEALRLLDIMVQLAVTSRSLTTPPPEPMPGDRYIPAAGALGAWAGQAGRIAFYEQDLWSFAPPHPGWQAWIEDEGTHAVFADGLWQSAADRPEHYTRLGVNTASDPVNRLAVAPEASLLTHTGQGHQVKINKASEGDTASLLFQTDWSGRAEIGTAGSDAFAIKVSPDGSSWTTALTIAPATGRMTAAAPLAVADGTAALPGLAFAADPDTGPRRKSANTLALVTGGEDRLDITPTGAVLNGVLSGTAVTQSTTDLSAGHLLKTGDFGMGRTIPLTAAMNLSDLTASGAYFNPAAANTVGNNYPINTVGSLLYLTDASSTRGTQMFIAYGTGVTYTRSKGAGGTWSNWRRLDAEHGDYLRLPDGTQICTRTVSLGPILANGAGTWASPYHTTAQTVAFAASFISAPVLSFSFPTVAGTGVTDRGMVVAGFDAGLASVTALRVARLGGSATTADVLCTLTATGRWF